METADIFNPSVRTLKMGEVELTVLEQGGPRIVALKYKGSENLFASVPQISVPTPFGNFHYVGGHRLWHAPEAMPRSYIPDNEGLTISEIPHGIKLIGKTEPATGMNKQIEISLQLERPQVKLTHILTNQNLWKIVLANWAITMFRLGGVAILPLQTEVVDREALLPDRKIVLWPYSNMNDPRLQLENDFILLSARQNLPAFKIGTFNPRGWVAYWNQSVLFQKTFPTFADVVFPDQGCNAEIYCDEHFIELESLAPLVQLEAGSQISYQEEWNLFDSLDQDFIPREIISLIKNVSESGEPLE